MVAEITAGEVEAAAAELRALKARRNVSDEEKAAATEEFAATRSAWRAQEVDAGRRGAGTGVGGDAVREG